MNYEEIIKSDRPFSIKEALKEGFSLYKKTIGWFILFGIIFIVGYFIIALFSMLLTFIPIIGPVLTFGVIFLFVICALAGIYRFLGKKYDGSGNFEDLFRGYKHLGQMLVFVILIVGITSLVIGIPVGILITRGANNSGLDIYSGSLVNLQQQTDIISLICFFFYVVGAFAVGFFFVFTVDLIINSDVPALKALQLSAKMAFRRFGKLLLVYLIFIGINIILFMPIPFMVENAIGNPNFLMNGGAGVIGYFVFIYFIMLFFTYPYMLTTLHVSYQLLFEKNKKNTQAEQLDNFGVPVQDSNTEEYSINS